MSFATYGDLASSYQTRHMNARLKQDLTQLGIELSTGRKANIATEIAGDFGPIAGIEHSLRLLTAHSQSTKEADLLLGASQAALGNIQDQTQALSSGLIGAISSQNDGLIKSTAVDAREKFSSIVANLNTSVAGRSVFAGSSTDGLAIAEADMILAELMTAIAGETTAAGVSTKIDDWFNAMGGGFEVSGYLGSPETIGPFRLGHGETAMQPITANDPEIRDVLSALAKSVVIAEGALAGDANGRKELATKSSHELLAANDQLILARSRVGAIEAKVELAAAQNTAEKAALEVSRNELTAADPYDTATAMQALYDQMKAMYTITAKLSELNFADYVR